MKNIMICTFLIFCCGQLLGQETCPNYTDSMTKGKQLFAQKNYEKALQEFQTAQLAARQCGITDNDSKSYVNRVFQKIQAEKNEAVRIKEKAVKEKEEAEQKKREAERQEQAAIAEKQLREEEKAAAEEAKLKAIQIQKKAEATLAEKEKVAKLAQKTSERSRALVEGIYFYENNYALGYNNQLRRFYFFDTLGQPHFDKLTFFDASVFGENGLAKVKVDENSTSSAFLDNTGQLVFWAEKLNQIDTNSTYVSLANKGFNFFPKQVLKKSQINNNETNRINTIKWLDLENNRIPRLPKKLKKLEGLEILNLKDNGLSKIPKSLTKLKKLTSLNCSNEAIYALGGNRFKRLPKNIGNLNNLKELNLAYHELSTLPESFADLQSLEQLNLQNNNLKSIPKSLYSLTALKTLNLSNNKIPASEIDALIEVLPNTSIIDTETSDKKRFTHTVFGKIGLNSTYHSLKYSGEGDYYDDYYDFKDKFSIKNRIELDLNIGYQINNFGLTINLYDDNPFIESVDSSSNPGVVAINKYGLAPAAKIFIQKSNYLRASFGVRLFGYLIYQQDSSANYDNRRLYLYEGRLSYLVSMEYLLHPRIVSNKWKIQSSIQLQLEFFSSKQLIGDYSYTDRNMDSAYLSSIPLNISFTKISIGYFINIGRVWN